MGPSNGSFLSIRAVFHFHAYGKKGKHNLEARWCRNTQKQVAVSPPKKNYPMKASQYPSLSYFDVFCVRFACWNFSVDFGKFWAPKRWDPWTSRGLGWSTGHPKAAPVSSCCSTCRLQSQAVTGFSTASEKQKISDVADELYPMVN